MLETKCILHFLVICMNFSGMIETKQYIMIDNSTVTGF